MVKRTEKKPKSSHRFTFKGQEVEIRKAGGQREKSQRADNFGRIPRILIDKKWEF